MAQRVKISVTLPPHVAYALRAAVGDQQVSAFVSVAITHHLERVGSLPAPDLASRIGEQVAELVREAMSAPGESRGRQVLPRPTS